jgi:hypothetical protein
MLPDTPWVNVHSRAFRQTGLFDYYENRPEELCQNITAIVQRAEAHPEETTAKVNGESVIFISRVTSDWWHQPCPFACCFRWKMLTAMAGRCVEQRRWTGARTT